MRAIFVIEFALLGHGKIHSIGRIKIIARDEKFADAGVLELGVFLDQISTLNAAFLIALIFAA